LTAADVMTPAPLTCSTHSTVLEAVIIFRDADCGAVPIMQEGKPTVYICGGGMCSPPITDAAVLSQVLKLPENSPFTRTVGNA